MEAKSICRYELHWVVQSLKEPTDLCLLELICELPAAKGCGYDCDILTWEIKPPLDIKHYFDIRTEIEV